ncbi:phage portal protein [Actinomadura yumaensis]|uniref:phage portal protein n=1 Tax=Actinomadura yumaensis TaxID=111807 RepID=UPI003608EE22
MSKAGAFVEVTSSRAGLPVRLDLLPPGRTRIIPGTGQDLVRCFEVARIDGTRAFVDPERVRWFRRPHPLDPYSGTTPLEAAGLSVEMDFFADMYNSSFLSNDARPAGVLGVEGDMDQDDMDRLEERFGRGPYEAGKTSVVGGNLSWVDLAARPRDMAYAELSGVTKDKILTAFGVPESVLGNASGRTFDNAEQEETNFWVFTMQPLLSIMSAAFDDDSSGELAGEFDTSVIDVLQRAEERKRDQARADFERGLISIDEYREIAGLERFDLPFTRALYVPAGKTPVPTREEDADALGMGSSPAAGPPAPADVQPIGAPPEEDPAADEAHPAPLAAAAPRALPAAPAPATGAAPPFGAPTVPAGKAAVVPLRRRPPRAKVRVVRETKAARPSIEPRARSRVEDAVAAALAAAAARLTERTAARVASPKTRKGTRHWAAADDRDTRAGAKELDAVSAVAPDRWAGDVEASVRPLLAETSAWFSGGGKDIAGYAARLAGARAADLAHQVTAEVVAADRNGASMDRIISAVRAYGDTAPDWARTVARDLVADLAAAARQDVNDGALPA